MRIAVIGTGISGNLVARLLNSKHDVHVYEASSHIGGHALTVDFEAFGSCWQADMGFMVFNDRTYPNFINMLDQLGVSAQPSDMSFSVSCRRTGVEYQGSSLNGLFAQRRNLVSPQFHRMLADIVRFNRASWRWIAAGDLESEVTVGEFLDRQRLGRAFRSYYLMPMVAAIWSADPATVIDFPARFLLGFMRNHGLLQLRNRPQWKTIAGRSRSYVDRLVAPFRDRIRLNCPVRSVARQADHVLVRTNAGETRRFDEVVFAAHSDQVLAMLDDPTPDERRLLGAFPYQANEAVLHTDLSILPRRRRAWASWNYHLPEQLSDTATLTYDLSRLQRLGTPAPVLLTLNRTDQIDPRKVIRVFHFDHPAYSCASVAAQQQFQVINGRNRTHFCGAYWGYGFHEDGVNSALAVARNFNLTIESCTAASTRDEFPTVGSSR